MASDNRYYGQAVPVCLKEGWKEKYLYLRRICDKSTLSYQLYEIDVSSKANASLFRMKTMKTQQKLKNNMPELQNQKIVNSGFECGFLSTNCLFHYAPMLQHGAILGREAFKGLRAFSEPTKLLLLLRSFSLTFPVLPTPLVQFIPL